MGYLHDPANVQQTSSKCNTRAIAGRLLDRVNTLSGAHFYIKIYGGVEFPFSRHLLYVHPFPPFC